MWDYADVTALPLSTHGELHVKGQYPTLASGDSVGAGYVAVDSDVNGQSFRIPGNDAAILDSGRHGVAFCCSTRI